MAFFRNPNAMGIVGGGLLGFGWLTFLATGENAVSWSLLVVAGALIFEWVMLHESAWVAGLFYQTDWREIEREIYSPLGSLARCVALVIILALAVVLGRAYFDILPDSPWGALIFVPMFGWFIWAEVAYWKAVRTAAREKGWLRR